MCLLLPVRAIATSGYHGVLDFVAGHRGVPHTKKAASTDAAFLDLLL